MATYSTQAGEPYFNVYIRQPILLRREGGRRIDAMVDMHNVLRQGHRPFVLTDGTLLMFAQDQRSLTAGLAFTF